MKLLTLFDSITEAKFRKPAMYYHGTSVRYLRSILKHGIVPSSKEQYWGDHQLTNSSVTNRSKASVGGSYWTTNLMTARSAALNTTTQKKEHGLMVIANIAEQSAFMDEDSLSVSMIWSNFMRTYGVVSDAYHFLVKMYFQTQKSRSEMVNRLATTMHEVLGGSPQQALPMKLAAEFLDAEIMRVLAHNRNDERPWDSFLYRVDKENRPAEIPSVADAERRLLDVQGELTKYYRRNAIRRDSNWNFHTLRTEQPVGFSGANRIIAIIEFPLWDRDRRDDPDYHPVDVLHYGTVPKEYIEAFRAGSGPYHGLVDPSGRVLIKPDPKRSYG